MDEKEPTPASQLERDLTSDIDDSRRLAKRSYVLAQMVFFLSILTSFVSAVVIAVGVPAETQAKVWTAICAAAPAALLTLNNTFKWEERTRWFWRKERLAYGLRARLLYTQNPRLDAISREYAEQSTKLEMEWPAMSAPPVQPGRPVPIGADAGIGATGATPTVPRAAAVAADSLRNAGLERDADGPGGRPVTR